ALHELEGHFLAAVRNGLVDFAEAAPAEAALEGVALQRLLAGRESEFHETPLRKRTLHASIYVLRFAEKDICTTVGRPADRGSLVAFCRVLSPRSAGSLAGLEAQ